MISGGMDVDIETGFPVDYKPDKHKELDRKRRERAISRYEDLINDLSGNGGEVLKLISDLFINRVDKLIREDPVCLAYQKVFDTIGLKMNAGKKIILHKLSGIEDNILEK